MLDTGSHATLEDLARAKGVHATYVSRILRLTLLAPDFVDAILDGRQAAELQLDDLLAGFPVEWVGQRTQLALVAPVRSDLRAVSLAVGPPPDIGSDDRT
jgi:hypothetical protein